MDQGGELVLEPVSGGLDIAALLLLAPPPTPCVVATMGSSSARVECACAGVMRGRGYKDVLGVVSNMSEHDTLNRIR